MFTKVGRSGGQVTWNFVSHAADGTETTYPVMGKWFDGYTGSTVFVTVRLPDGTQIERRGTLNVERSVFGDKVFFATVSSLNGDVKGEGRYVKAAVEDFVSQVLRVVLDQERKSPLQVLVERNSITGTHSAALGAAVSRKAAGESVREVLGTIVDVSEPGRLGVWVRRYHDDAETSVWYSVRELELATQDDLVQVARYFLGRQYRETAELQATVKAARP